MGRDYQFAKCGEHHIWVGVLWTIVEDNGYEYIYDIESDKSVFLWSVFGWQHENRDSEDGVSGLFERLRDHFSNDGDGEIPMEQLGTWTNSTEAYFVTKARRYRAQYGDIEKDMRYKALAADEHNEWIDSENDSVLELPFPRHLLPIAQAMLQSESCADPEARHLLPIAHDPEARHLLPIAQAMFRAESCAERHACMHADIFLSAGLSPPRPFDEERLILKVEAFPDGIWNRRRYENDTQLKNGATAAEIRAIMA